MNVLCGVSDSLGVFHFSLFCCMICAPSALQMNIKKKKKTTAWVWLNLYAKDVTTRRNKSGRIKNPLLTCKKITKPFVIDRLPRAPALRCRPDRGGGGPAVQRWVKWAAGNSDRFGIRVAFWSQEIHQRRRTQQHLRGRDCYGSGL